MRIPYSAGEISRVFSIDHPPLFFHPHGWIGFTEAENTKACKEVGKNLGGCVSSPSGNLLSYLTPEGRAYELFEIAVMGMVEIFSTLYHSVLMRVKPVFKRL